MPVTLGISCFYHDAAAALVRDGHIVAAAQEERFSRKKGDPSFPLSAISYCLEEGNLSAKDIDTVAYYDQPVWSFERLIHSYLAAAPLGLRSWLTAMPKWLSRKFHIPHIIQDALDYQGSVLFIPHHLSHAASAFYPSPYQEAAILTIDGVGEWATSSYGIGEKNIIQLRGETRFPHSLGLLYSSFTYFCGFKVNSGEYKLMGLAPYGEPIYLETIKKNIAEIASDGSVNLNLAAFNFLGGLTMISKRFSKVFGGPPRRPESQITKREMDIAASIQAFIEEAVVKMAAFVHHQTGAANLCMAGGVALNCKANKMVQQEGLFNNIWVQPAAGDAGGALGAALAAEYGHHDVLRTVDGDSDLQQGSYLGPRFSKEEVIAFLEGNNYPYRPLDQEEQAETVARAVASGAIVGFFNGRIEFGPRALGNRSILGDPRSLDTQRVMNLKIKFRESFRPFAPAVRIEDADEFFEIDQASPYMLFLAPVKASRCYPLRAGVTNDLVKAVNTIRSDIPSVTHWDYSARVQTVDRRQNPRFHEVLTAFKKITSYGVLVNTSFNVRGEPIVCTPTDAYSCFMNTEMDFLCMEGCWLVKTEQPQKNNGVENRNYALD